VAAGVTIDAQSFTREGWAPFGWVPVADTDGRDAVHTLAFAWGDAHLNFISHGPEEVKHANEGLVVDAFYRHDSHTQALMPVNCESVIAVAPAIVDFSGPHQLEAVKAFVLRPGTVFVLHRGTWHWGPFPLGAQPVRLLNLQGRRYREDNTSVDLQSRLGARVVVRTAGGAWA
jgi:ureidoglycolate hydrolase